MFRCGTPHSPIEGFIPVPTLGNGVIRMISKILTVAWVLCFLFSIGLVEGASSCSGESIHCRSGDQCVRIQDICRNGVQCNDGSDESHRICSFWTHDSNCRYESFYWNRGSRCVSFREFCTSAERAAEKDSRICEIVNRKRLHLPSDDDETGLILTEQLVNLVQQAVNGTSKASTPCPMFFSRVGDQCLSFFSPARISWPEARQFCLSIGGELLSIKKVTVLEDVLNYMRDSHFTSDYWIGGRFDLDSNAWAWVQDDSAMPLGSPYWAVRYNQSCVLRSPPHTDPYSSPPAGLPGAHCFRYIQSPQKRAAGWCASMTYEHYYFFTDDTCQEKMSPLCSYSGNFHQKLIVTEN
ncbi:uncharacterized protein LOC135224332 isoform X2 [Macrobrachium nipponense]|uniref:uncharacterized protein LOC135224332 isoform X2 n=1 Tax=Macrobrachium nipponense TaxID=159736 RepID=UPI0030C81A34